jgi:predicted secreted protein
MNQALADSATLKIRGFTEDEKVFVFEEFGAQDGSGFPYSSFHYVSVDTNEYVSKSPLKHVSKTVKKQINSARLNSKNKAEKLTGITSQNLVSGSLIAFNPVTEISTNNNLMEFALNANDLLNGKTWIVKLNQFSMGALEGCVGLVEYIAGFEIIILGPSSSIQPKQVYSDIEQPKQRGCVDSYKLGGVYAYLTKNGEWIIAFLVSVKSVGFEGYDYRWLARLTKLPSN